VGAMIGTAEQKAQFSDRLNRIAMGGENTTRHLFIGPVPEAANGKPAKVTRNTAVVLWDSRFSGLQEVVMVPFAMAVGALAVVVGRAVEYHFVTEELALRAGSLGAYAGYSNLLLSALFILILGRALQIGRGARGKAEFVGFMAMLMFEGLAVVRFPEVFSVVYSADYVAEVTARLPV
jgi:hypothetical protein